MTRVRIVLVAVLAICALGAVAGDANAEWRQVGNEYSWFHNNTDINVRISPEQFEAKARRLSGHGIRYGATGQPVPYGQTQNAAQVQAMLEGLGSDSTQKRRVKAKALAAGQRFGTLPLLRTVGTMALTFGAWEVGWRIGTVASKWLGLTGKIPAAPAPSYTDPKVQWKPDTLAPWACGTSCTNHTPYQWKSPGEFFFTMSRNGVSGASNTNEAPNGAEPCGSLYYPKSFARALENQSNGDAFTLGYQWHKTGDGTCVVPNPPNAPEDVAIEKGIVTISEEDVVDDVIGGGPVPYAGQPVTVHTEDRPPAVPDEVLLQRARLIMQDPAMDPYTRFVDENTDPGLDPVPPTQPEPTAPPALVDLKAMPDCIGLSYNACLTALQDAGFGVVERVNLSFEDAIPLPDGQADQVTATAPVAGVVAGVDDPVTVTANPAADDMPFIMPGLLGKTIEDAESLLAPYGWPSPQLEPLPEDAPHLDYGPNTITEQSPQAGTRQRVGSTPHPAPGVTGRVNPSSAPIPGGSGGSCGLTAPAAAFDLSPIVNASVGNVFPFAFAGILADATSGLALGSTRPNAEFNAFGATEDMSFLSNFDPVVTLFRTAVAFLLWLGAAWSLYGWTIGRNA